MQSLLQYEPKPIQILKINTDRIDWRIFIQPQSIIYKLDYEAMKKSMQPFAEELAAYVFHTLRMDKIAQQYNIPFDELINEIY